jgi:pilus assembly protein CpaE
MSSILLVSPSADFEGNIRASYDGALTGEFRYWRDDLLSGDPRELVERLAGTGAGVVILGPAVDTDAVMELARIFDRDHPDVVVAIVTETTADLWAQAVRAGVRAVVEPAVSPQELRPTLDEVLQTAAARRERRAAGATGDEVRNPGTRVIAVISPKGGSGKTTTATNLAVGLAQVAPNEVVIVDVDLQFGDVASALRLTPEKTISDTIRAGVLDTTTLKVLLTPHPASLFALCAPESLAQADDIDPGRLADIVQPLASDFRYIVIDTAAGIDPYALAAIELATDLLVVSTTDVPCVRGVRKAIEALDAVGFGDKPRHFLLNRADARVGLSSSDIESTLGVHVDVSVPSSQGMWLSLNSGTPILESDPTSPAGRAMSELVDRFVPEDLAHSSSSARTSGGGFRRRRKGRS